MTYQSVAIVFGPTLLKPEKETGNIAVHTVYQNQIVELILLEINSIFGRWFLIEDNLWSRSRIPSDFKSLYMMYFIFGPSSDSLILHFFEGSEGNGRVKMCVGPSHLLLCYKLIYLCVILNWFLSWMFAFHTLNFSKNQNLQFNQSYTLDNLVRKLHFFSLKLDNVEFLLMIC